MSSSFELPASMKSDSHLQAHVGLGEITSGLTDAGVLRSGAPSLIYAASKFRSAAAPSNTAQAARRIYVNPEVCSHSPWS
jgi:hypothetical protein